MDKDGASVAFRRNSGTVEVAIGDSTIVAASGLQDSAPSFAPAHSATRWLPEAAPAFAFAVSRKNGLAVVWSSGGAFREVPIVDTRVAPVGCENSVAKIDGSCPADCVERTRGVLEAPLLWGGATHAQFDIGRADDGTAWLAYLVTDIDKTFRYTEFCTEVCGGWCRAQPFEDRSLSELHVVHVPFDGSPPSEVMRLPLGQFSDGAVEDPFVSVRAFGARVAIGVHGLTRSREADGEKVSSHARIVTLELAAASTR